jgi:F420-dependent oxidoreductase-like protein
LRIGLTGGGTNVDKIIGQAQRAEADGFSTLWYSSMVLGDPLVAMAIVGRETSTIEVGTAVLQTYPCHPLLQANRLASVTVAMGRPGLTLGIGPSHEPVVRGVYGLPYDHPGRNTEEYIRTLAGLLRGETVDFDGQDWTVHSAGRSTAPQHPVPILLSALGPRMLRVAGQIADGTILWMAPIRAVEKHVVPKIHAAAAAAGRPVPRIVAGLPIAVHDDVDEARAAAGESAGMYAGMPNYQRILDIGEAANPAAAAIVGDEKSVTAQLRRLAETGATDFWASILPIGADQQARTASVRRTRGLLRELATIGRQEPRHAPGRTPAANASSTTA